MTNENDSLSQNSGSGTAQVALGPAIFGEEVDLRLRPESRLFGYLEGDPQGIEQYRLLHARLLDLQSRAPLKRVLITSAGRGEGKTNVAANLALTIARESDKKILLVDADIRKPDVHNVYGIANDRGLSDILRNGRDVGKVIRRVANTNLHVLTAGPGAGQAFTIVSALSLRMLLDQLGPVFDWVLIDSPPVLMAADASLLAKMADGILLVVRGNKTPRELVERGKQMLGSTLLGVVLNGVSPLRATYNSYYGTSPVKSGKRL